MSLIGNLFAKVRAGATSIELDDAEWAQLEEELSAYIGRIVDLDAMAYHHSATTLFGVPCRRRQPPAQDVTAE